MRKFLIVLCVALMLLAGCSGNQDQQQNAGSQFVGGNVGITMKFAEGSIPPQVFDKDQPFGISVIVTNNGDHTIDSGADATVTISGIDPADFGLTAADLTMDSPAALRGAQKDVQGNVIQGETASYDFPANGGSFTHSKEISGSVTYNIRANACYKYGTIANTKLCVLEDLLGTKSGANKLCEINADKPMDNSGAPVTVTSFKESVSSGNKVSFVFTVAHTGTGKVHERSSECSDDFQKKDKVHIKVDTGISDGLTCSGLQNGVESGSSYEGDAQLLNGQREIRCMQNINNPTDMEKLVVIDLSYDYSQYVEQSLEVVHAGN